MRGCKKKARMRDLEGGGGRKTHQEHRGQRDGKMKGILVPQ